MRFLSLICMLALSLTMFAQDVTLSGTVQDNLGEPLPGASVYQKGNTRLGTVTDIDGNFSIMVPQGATVEFSYIGYTGTQYVARESKNDLIITLQESANMLDEVVAVGYGVQKKSVMSTAISKVSADELNLGNPTNVQNALKGKVSGVSIISDSGQPGSSSKIRIRGTSTINSSDPLYIVDGMVTESGIDQLNPSDIESIEILKDAASAAIYGARGSNGVVLVTTKKGSYDQRATVTYEFTYGWQNPSKKLDLLKTPDYLMLAREAAANAGSQYVLQGSESVNTDWQRAFQYKDAPVMNHRVSLSGGGSKTTYYASFGYVEQDGIYAKGHANYKRTNFRVNFNQILMDFPTRTWLNKAEFNAIAAFTESKQTGNTISNSEAAGLFTSINMLPPTQPVYQTDPAELERYDRLYPNHVIAPNGLAYNIIELREINNPLASMQVNNNQVTKPRTFNYNLGLSLNVWNGIRLRTNFSSEYVNSSTKNVVPVYELNTTTQNANSWVYDSKSSSSYWQWENVLSYNNTFGLHSVGAILGTTMSSYHYETINGTDYDLLAVDIDKGYIDTATAAEQMSKVSSWGSDHRIASFFARVSYNYDEKYLLEAVVRRDGSSNFGPKHKYATFPSVSAGWVFTREKFMENLPQWFNFGKLRFSWGMNGNENIGAFKYTAMMGQGFPAIYNGKIYTSYLPTGYANADLKWESTEQYDLGLDLRFLNSALTFTVDYFNKRTHDMLLNMPIPMYTSYSMMTVNGGTVKNEGVEMDLTYRFRANKVNLSIGANASYVKNTVQDQGPERVGLNSIGGGLGGQISYRENGRPYGFFYGYQTNGIFQNQAELDAYPHLPEATVGDLRFVDRDGDGVIGPDDRTMIGKPNPDWTFGLNLGADWNGLDVSLFFQGMAGNDIYKMYRRPNLPGANFDSTWLKRWHGEGTSNTVPRVVEGDNYNYLPNQFFVEDGSYFRLKVAQIGYTLPQSLTRKIGIQKFRVFVQGENLFTITKYTGYDPEVGTRDGFDGGTYPAARTFTVGFNIAI